MLLVVRMSVGRLLQASGPATLNARSPNFNDVRGTSNASLSADRRPGCLMASSRSETWFGDWPFKARWTSRHSLKCIRARIGSQCSSMVASVTWSLGQRPYTSLVAALMTRCRTDLGTNLYVNVFPSAQLRLLHHWRWWNLWCLLRVLCYRLLVLTQHKLSRLYLHQIMATLNSWNFTGKRFVLLSFITNGQFQC